MLVALDFSLAKPQQIVIAGNEDADDTRALLAEVHRHYLPHRSCCSPMAARARNVSRQKLN